MGIMNLSTPFIILYIKQKDTGTFNNDAECLCFSIDVVLEGGHLRSLQD